ncbi:hypothetical protein B0H21DRAFT_67484 [Amylocystis lapponica]|nr:hypothetical protein B0H21DRAFT_67484 [Amylocystis lapponica]
MQSAISRLPSELWDLIIDSFQHDRRSLLACSLASRSWLPRIRSILFHNASIANELEYLEFESIVEASPEIAGLVRKLEWFPTGKSPKYDWLHRELFRILKVLDKVEELHISRWRAPELSEDMKQDLSTVPVFPMVTTLRFSAVELPLKEDLVRILRACPRLHELKFIGCKRSDGPVPSPAPRDILLSETPSALVPTTMTMINSLEWASSDLYIVECLLQGPFTLNLRSLHIVHDFPSIDSIELHALYAQRLIRAAGASLEELSIDLAPHLPPLEEYIDLSHNPSLVSLGLQNIELSAQKYKEGWDVLLRALASVHSSHLEEITMLFCMKLETHEEDLDTLDWKELDKLLTHLVHDRPELTVGVIFDVIPSADPAAWWNTLEDCRKMAESVKIRLSRMETNYPGRLEFVQLPSWMVTTQPAR